MIEQAADRFIEACVDLDPVQAVRGRVRGSDGRSEWIEPVAAHITSDAILVQEMAILTWAYDAHSLDPEPSMLSAAFADLGVQGRGVCGVSPTAKAARTLERKTGMSCDTVAKLVHEWTRPDRPADTPWRLPAGTTLIVDEASMMGTTSLHHLIELATVNEWRLALIGDPRQLQAVGRGGTCASFVVW